MIFLAGCDALLQSSFDVVPRVEFDEKNMAKKLGRKLVGVGDGPAICV